LFFRRIHLAAVSAQLNDQAQLYAYSPAKAGRAVFREWRLLYEHYRAAARVTLPPRERLVVCLFLLKMGLWKRDELMRELIAGGFRARPLRH
jgi:hypothetical protein